MTRLMTLGIALAIAVPPCTVVRAQESRRSLDIGINHTGISIGDSRVWRGIRLNVRDSRLERVTGINATIWSARNNGSGDVRGIAIGLPSTGGKSISGLAVGGFGAGAKEDFAGIGIAGLGIGAGGRMSGIVIAGLGAGAGGSVRGIAIGGLGVGTGGNASGILIGGLGAGAGGNVHGIAIGGLGIGAGGDVSGIAIGGLGVGAGGSLRGLGIGGLGVGAPNMHGVALGGLGVGGQNITGIAVAGGMVKVAPNGTMNGAAIATTTQVRGHMTGLAIGVVNYAWSLSGVQVGVINIVRDNPRARRVLPVINWGSGT